MAGGESGAVGGNKSDKSDKSGTNDSDTGADEEYLDNLRSAIGVQHMQLVTHLQVTLKELPRRQQRWMAE